MTHQSRLLHEESKLLRVSRAAEQNHSGNFTESELLGSGSLSNFQLGRRSSRQSPTHGFPIALAWLLAPDMWHVRLHQDVVDNTFGKLRARRVVGRAFLFASLHTGQLRNLRPTPYRCLIARLKGPVAFCSPPSSPPHTPPSCDGHVLDDAAATDISCCPSLKLRRRKSLIRSCGQRTSAVVINRILNQQVPGLFSHVFATPLRRASGTLSRSETRFCATQAAKRADVALCELQVLEHSPCLICNVSELVS